MKSDGFKDFMTILNLGHNYRIFRLGSIKLEKKIDPKKKLSNFSGKHDKMNYIKSQNVWRILHFLD